MLVKYDGSVGNEWGNGRCVTRTVGFKLKRGGEAERQNNHTFSSRLHGVSVFATAFTGSCLQEEPNSVKSRKP